MASGLLIWFFSGLYVGSLLPKEDFVQEYKLSALGDSDVPNYVTVTDDNNWKYYTFMTNTSSGKIIEQKMLRNVDIVEGDYDPTVTHH